MRRIGAEYEVTDDGIAFSRAGSLKPLSVRTDVHPGFMTDWQQPLCVLLTQAEGNIHNPRNDLRGSFWICNDLNAMGAEIKVSDRLSGRGTVPFCGKGILSFAARVKGPTDDQKQELHVRDLRSGMVDILAALVANGVSEVDGVDEIDRGYERIDERLRELGADIKRI